MLSIELIRREPDAVRAALRRRGGIQTFAIPLPNTGIGFILTTNLSGGIRE